MKKLALVALASLSSIGCYRVIVQWPSEPLKVEIVNCPALSQGAATDGGSEAIDAATPPPAEQRASFSAKGGRAFRLAGAGTLVFVEYTGSDGLRVLEVDGSGDDACGRGGEEIWRLGAGGRWDAVHAVPAGKVVCAEATGASDGDVVWLFRGAE
ncbi:MAG: hypothetical protein EXR72_27160 [Myxococcales bacterium]|nr:hypothetical protein [Myxococcales bacterium]